MSYDTPPSARRKQHRAQPRESRSPNAAAPRSRRPTVECWCLSRTSVVKQQGARTRSTALPRLGRRGSFASLGMDIPDVRSPHLATLRRWGDRVAPRWIESDTLWRSRLPRATCGLLAVIVLSAQLLPFQLDPHATRRDATGAETRDRARARPADAGRAESS